MTAPELSRRDVEVEKMIKLVEASNMHREVPLVSFIARQRNLAEMVGEDYAGVENLRLYDSQHAQRSSTTTWLVCDRRGSLGSWLGPWLRP